MNSARQPLIRTYRHASARRRRAWRLRRLALQILILLGFWLAGEGFVRATAVPVPGGVVGLFLLLGLLATKRLGLRRVRRGARWFLAEMLLFFVPALLAVLDHPEFLGRLGLKLLAVILLGTLVVMMATALAVEACYRWHFASSTSHGAQ